MGKPSESNLFYLTDSYFSAMAFYSKSFFFFFFGKFKVYKILMELADVRENI